MNKFLVSVILGLLTVFSFSSIAAERLVTCAVNNIPQGYKGIRVNIIFSRNKLKATVFEGTTMNSSGTFWISETDRGYEGADRTGQRIFSLLLSKTAVENNYIRGVRASLQSAVIKTANGDKTLSTKTSDGFVCGKQVNPYGN